MTLPGGFQEQSAPQTPLRGHQLGYRPKTNSYDGWTVAMWEQYIRDLAVFGCNAIELIPPRSDDDADSPHFPLPPLRMMIEVSRLADDYGLDVWIWYPAMDRDYADPETVETRTQGVGRGVPALPRIDAVFVPGGDPGHTRPKVLFDLLEKQTANLHRYHPKAQMWVSPQSFTAPWLDEFYELINKEPAWLLGHRLRPAGPRFACQTASCGAGEVSDSRLPRHHAQSAVPVPGPRLGPGLRHDRRARGVQPPARADGPIFRYGRPHTIGFITYSEGCHDDVNKIVWSALGWNPDADVSAVLRQYGRYFIGPALGDRFASGLAALERNWTGAVLENAGIDETLKLFPRWRMMRVRAKS